MTQTKTKPSKNARAQAARLAAVQAVYQMGQNAQSAKSVIGEYIDLRSGMEIDGESFVPIEKALFSKIVQTVAEKEQDIGEVLFNTLKKEDKTPKEIESLLKSILYCGVGEVMAHTDIDTGIIINDYIEVSKAFYGSSEKNLVNAVLDKIAKVLR